MGIPKIEVTENCRKQFTGAVGGGGGEGGEPNGKPKFITFDELGGQRSTITKATTRNDVTKGNYHFINNSYRQIGLGKMWPWRRFLGEKYGQSYHLQWAARQDRSRNREELLAAAQLVQKCVAVQRPTPPVRNELLDTGIIQNERIHKEALCKRPGETQGHLEWRELWRQ